MPACGLPHSRLLGLLPLRTWLLLLLLLLLLLGCGARRVCRRSVGEEADLRRGQLDGVAEELRLHALKHAQQVLAAAPRHLVQGRQQLHLAAPAACRGHGPPLRVPARRANVREAPLRHADVVEAAATAAAAAAEDRF